MLTQDGLRNLFSSSFNFKPTELINLFSTQQEIDNLFNAPAGVVEGSTVRSHTLDVLNILSKYPFDRKLVPILALTFAFHDLNKKPLTKNLNFDMSKEAQHERSLEVFERYQHLLPPELCNFQLMRYLIGGDHIGPFMKSVRDEPALDDGKLRVLKELETIGEQARIQLLNQSFKNWEKKAVKKNMDDLDSNIEEVARLISEGAASLNMKAEELLKYQMAYYCCDCTSYLLMGYLFQREDDNSQIKFQFNQEQQRFLFSHPFEEYFLKLRKAVR